MQTAQLEIRISQFSAWPERPPTTKSNLFCFFSSSQVNRPCKQELKSNYLLYQTFTDFIVDQLWLSAHYLPCMHYGPLQNDVHDDIGMHLCVSVQCRHSESARMCVDMQSTEWTFLQVQSNKSWNNKDHVDLRWQEVIVWQLVTENASDDYAENIQVHWNCFLHMFHVDILLWSKHIYYKHRWIFN